MDILNGHPKWAQDGRRCKNTYGLVSIVINIAMKEIDRKRSMLRGHVSSNNRIIHTTHHFWRRGNTFRFMSSSWFSDSFYRLLQTTCWWIRSSEGAKSLQRTKYTEYTKYYFRYVIYSTPFRKIAHKTSMMFLGIGSII